MSKIVKVKEAISIADDLHKQSKNIVLVGGCFDILHVGHITFLQKAKEYGDILLVLLESDEAIKKTKGANRPIHVQEDRARVLAALEAVDIIVMLPFFNSDSEYDNLLSKLKPIIIATTRGDTARYHKERQANLIQAKVVDVISRIENKSTSRLAKLLSYEI